MIGTTIETSIRIMSRWGKDDIVRTEKDGFVVCSTAPHSKPSRSPSQPDPAVASSRWEFFRSAGNSFAVGFRVVV